MERAQKTTWKMYTGRYRQYIYFNPLSAGSVISDGRDENTATECRKPTNHSGMLLKPNRGKMRTVPFPYITH